MGYVNVEAAISSWAPVHSTHCAPPLSGGKIHPVTRPSQIPPGGRALSPAEYAHLVEEMTVFLGTSHLFKSLDAEGRGRVLECGYVTTFSQGDVIVRQGDPGDVMFLILDGRVKIETDTPAGVVMLAELGKSACVGEVALLTGEARTATVTALTDVDAVAFARHRIERILADYPKVAVLLQTLVERRARDTIEKIIG